MNKPEGESGTTQRTLAGNFEVSNNLTDKRGLRITGYIYNDDTPGEINARVDAAMDVMDRQLIRADIVTKDAQIEMLKGNLLMVSQGYEEIIEKRDRKDDQGRPTKLSTVEKDRIRKFDHDVRSLNNQIEFMQGLREAARKKLEEE